MCKGSSSHHARSSQLVQGLGLPKRILWPDELALDHVVDYDRKNTATTGLWTSSTALSSEPPQLPVQSLIVVLLSEVSPPIHCSLLLGSERPLTLVQALRVVEALSATTIR